MLEVVLTTVLIIMSISMFICFIRTIIGPSMSDRIVALDSFGMNLIGFIGIVMMLQNSVAYSEVLLVLGILAFIGSVALSKFLEKGDVFDRG
ncbi:Na(+)/H(+) antiporter subunit F1 [Halalkalibacterium ligniniphilum]|uniref:Na(+)/H(+) antiporter subunit F1 n=1 Tax=Halalkalibacterium ligniniphilum TaxID=1134413 RepID=UPI00034CF0AA|nr:Na(+)/H(+) antiporter subunit F1 [Halalkalibacterium ligniniphilum]